MVEPILNIKPKFCIFSRAIVNLRKELAVTLGLEFIIVTFMMIVVIATKNPVVINLIENSQEEFVLYTYLLVMGLIVFIFPLSVLLLGFLDKKNFEVTNYKVFDDRIEFDEGFINHKHSSILFKDVKEIHLDQSFIQKKYNIATIRFITSANNAMNETSIRFQDIENAQIVYNKVKEIHERS